MSAPGTELSAFPAVLGGGAQSPGSPSPGGPVGMPIGEDAPADDSGAMDLEELGGMCGDIYADVFGVAGQFYVGVAVELPAERAARRGKQLAIVLRKLGWGDDEILCYVGLTAGVAGDFAMLHRAKLEIEAEKKAKEPKAPASDATHVGGAPA